MREEKYRMNVQSREIVILKQHTYYWIKKNSKFLQLSTHWNETHKLLINLIFTIIELQKLIVLNNFLLFVHNKRKFELIDDRKVVLIFDSEFSHKKKQKEKEENVQLSSVQSFGCCL